MQTFFFNFEQLELVFAAAGAVLVLMIAVGFLASRRGLLLLGMETIALQHGEYDQTRFRDAKEAEDGLTQAWFDLMFNLFWAFLFFLVLALVNPDLMRGNLLFPQVQL